MFNKTIVIIIYNKFSAAILIIADAKISMVRAGSQLMKDNRVFYAALLCIITICNIRQSVAAKFKSLDENEFDKNTLISAERNNIRQTANSIVRCGVRVCGVFVISICSCSRLSLRISYALVCCRISGYMVLRFFSPPPITLRLRLGNRYFTQPCVKSEGEWHQIEQFRIFITAADLPPIAIRIVSDTLVEKMQRTYYCIYSPPPRQSLRSRG